MYSLLLGQQQLEHCPPKVFVQPSRANSLPVVPVTHPSRPQSGRVYRSPSRTVPTAANYNGGPKYDQLSLDSVPIISTPASLSSKSFWSMDMLRQRELTEVTPTTADSNPDPHHHLPHVNSTMQVSPYRKRRTGSMDSTDKPKLQAILREKRNSLIDMYGTGNMSLLHHPSQATPTKPKPSLSGLYGVQQDTKRNRRDFSRLLQLPPLRKSASEELR